MDPLTEEEREAYSKATKCHICDGDITDYRILYNGGATHSRCVDVDRDFYDKNLNKEEFKGQERCSVCDKPFVEEKVRDHCHITIKTIKLNYQIPKVVPAVFHNLAKYDAHLYMKELGKIEGDINCIAKTEKKTIYLSVKRLQLTLVKAKMVKFMSFL